jgi:hypothetical protein
MLIATSFMGLLMTAPLSFGPNSPAIVKEVAQVSEMKCPVTGKPIPPGGGVKVVVHGHDYTVYDQPAAEELKRNPDKYIDADGVPKNTKKPDGMNTQ